MKLKWCAVVAVLVAALGVGVVQYGERQRARRYQPWHATDEWRRLLRVYDRLAAKRYGHCERAQFDTRWGSTRAYVCGDAAAPPVVLLHGAGSSALMYTKWLGPQLAAQGHRVVAVDYVCDVGRSAPPANDTARCPSTHAHMVEWFRDVVAAARLRTPVSAVGYSYGAFIGACVARGAPGLIDRFAAVAPAPFVAPIGVPFVLRALAYSAWSTPATMQWFFASMSVAGADFDMRRALDDDDYELADAARSVAGSVLVAASAPFTDDELRAVVAGARASALFIGRNETVTDAPASAARAEQFGMRARTYADSGHLMFMEAHADAIAHDIVHFVRTAQLPPPHQ